MKHHLNRSFSSSRRGSVFLLVVAILAVLGLMTMTLSYGARMQLRASRNTVDAMQARLAALTGVPFVGPGNPLAAWPKPGRPSSGLPSNSTALTTLNGLNSNEQDKYISYALRVDPRAAASSQQRAEVYDEYLGSQGLKYKPKPTSDADGRGDKTEEELNRQAIIDDLAVFTGPISVSRMYDESAKFNINALLPSPEAKERRGTQRLQDIAANRKSAPPSQPNTEELARLIETALVFHEVRSDYSALDLANALVNFKYGDDQKPGSANVDDNGNAGQQNAASDGMDNDLDQVVDNPEEESLAPDADGIDNNLNGVVDEQGESRQTDGIDNDHDGQVDESDESVDEPEEFTADVRRPARGDDRPFKNLAELTAVRGFTPEVIRALSPYLTVFSASQPAYVVRKSTGSIEAETLGYRQVDPNTARPKEIFEALKRRYPNAPEDLLGQFTANIVDRRDVDSLPSKVEVGTGGKSYIGFELTPCINEVYPYTGTYDPNGDGDDGQFIEIYNPHTRSVDVNGWRIEGAAGSIRLEGSIPEGGYLVVTDDYNESTDANPERISGQGSLYDLFGVVPTGAASRILVSPSFNLSDDEGSVSLLNEDGIVVDTFRYSDGKLIGAARDSFQRRDPLVRRDVFTRADAEAATPLRANEGQSELDDDERDTMRIVEAFQNQPFLSPLEILMVPTNYEPTSTGQADANPTTGATQETTTETQTPKRESQGGLRLPYLPISNQRLSRDQEFEQAAINTDNLDVSVVDLFMPGIAGARPTQIFKALLPPATGAMGPEGANLAENRLELKQRELRDQPPALFGRVNVNTAPAAVLAALPGFGNSMAYAVTTLRDYWIFGSAGLARKVDRTQLNEAATRTPEWFEALPPQESPRWRSLSEFISDTDLWGDSTLNERWAIVYPFANMITFYSVAYRVVTENLPPPNSEKDDPKRRARVIHAERIVAGDRGKTETVSFRYLNSTLWNNEDRDSRYGIAETDAKAKDYSKAVFEKAAKHVEMPVYEGPSFLNQTSDRKAKQNRDRRAAAGLRNAASENDSSVGIVQEALPE